MKNFKRDFINRELSWLEFNRRVLEEAVDEKTAVMERLKFMAIFSNNLDEFFMVRVSGVISQIKSNYEEKDYSGYTPKQLLNEIRTLIEELVIEQTKCFHQSIMPELKKNGFHLYNAKDVPKEYINELSILFHEKYYPVLSPMAIDQSRPFPFISGKTLNILVRLKSETDNNELKMALIPIPTQKRFIKVGNDDSSYIMIGEFIKLFASSLFNGYTIEEMTTFRITRDAELNIEEEESKDLLSTIENELKNRDKGTPVRVEIESDVSDITFEYIKQKIPVTENIYFKIDHPLDFSSFFYIVSLPGFDHLHIEPLPPITPVEFTEKKSIFKIIAEKDRILHHPFESFDPVVKFIEEAANDPGVLAIKQTLYRTSGDSPIIAALKKAAQKGKQVTVIVELKARFDELQNINWAKQLEKAGCHVVYGLVGLKIHCKILLVVREEEDGIKRYIHLSTGNYNDKTAKIYTDISLFTKNEVFGIDASAIFNLLTGYSRPPMWKKIITAPLDLRNEFLERINLEITNVKNGGKGKIIAKMNSLIDKKIIEALYKASNAGVEIMLIIRGICCLRPGIKDLSDKITVISVVDRFLEHTRIYYFFNGGDEDIYLSSADWMERNFDRRVETLFPVEDNECKSEILNYISIILKGNQKTRQLLSDGSYIIKPMADGDLPFRSQIELYKYEQKRNLVSKDKSSEIKFIPRKRVRSKEEDRL